MNLSKAKELSIKKLPFIELIKKLSWSSFSKSAFKIFNSLDLISIRDKTLKASIVNVVSVYEISFPEISTKPPKAKFESCTFIKLSFSPKSKLLKLRFEFLKGFSSLFLIDN